MNCNSEEMISDDAAKEVMKLLRDISENILAKAYD